MLRVVAFFLVQVLAMPPLALWTLVGRLALPRREFISWSARYWGRLSLWTTGARVRFENVERLMNTRPAVVVFNHASAVDVVIACAHLPVPFRMVAKEELFRIPFLGWAMRIGGFVPLERAGGRRDVERLLKMPWDPARRAVFCFYPEGTRSQDGRLKRFKRGAFVTALREQVPIVPVAICGSHHVQPAGSFRPRAGEVVVKVLEPVPTAGLSGEDRERVTEEAWRRICAALPEDQKPQMAQPARPPSPNWEPTPLGD